MDLLARNISEASHEITDEEVAEVAEKAGSERAAIELIAASALGADLYRWQRGLEVLHCGERDGPAFK